MAWGDNSSGHTNVPEGLTNVVAISAGMGTSDSVLALKNDGTMVAVASDESETWLMFAAPGGWGQGLGEVGPLLVRPDDTGPMNQGHESLRVQNEQMKSRHVIIRRLVVNRWPVKGPAHLNGVVASLDTRLPDHPGIHRDEGGIPVPGIKDDLVGFADVGAVRNGQLQGVDARHIGNDGPER